MLERKISEEVLKKFAKPMALIQRRNVGVFITKSGTTISIGIPGEGDYSGIIGGQLCPHCNGKIHPIPFYLETKSSTGKQRRNQIHFQKEIWERRGGIYSLANDPEVDYLKVIEDKARLISLLG